MERLRHRQSESILCLVDVSIGRLLDKSAKAHLYFTNRPTLFVLGCLKVDKQISVLEHLQSNGVTSSNSDLLSRLKSTNG